VRIDARREQLAELVAARKELAASQSEAVALKAERQGLRDEIASLRTKLGELEGALRAEASLRRELSEQHAKTAAGLRERVSELESRQAHGADLRERLKVLEEEAAQAAELETLLAERDVRIAALEAKLAAAPRDTGSDDLKVLRGVGPKFEKALKAIGVTTLAQIAAWSGEDVTRIAEKLNVSPERIRRDDWVARAQKLVAK
jgi:predicted flap endonuclease-1-like 5' DNA nuclease